jgi:DNA-binding transcriptional MerR regulator
MNPSGAEVEPLSGIPEKLYFRIGEASRLIGVAPYVLRFWETEFPALAPKKSGAGHRFYRRKDVELLLEIKQLLYEKRYTIEGARKHLEAKSHPARRERPAKVAAAAAAPAAASQQTLFGDPQDPWQSIRSELTAILDLLK